MTFAQKLGALIGTVVAVVSLVATFVMAGFQFGAMREALSDAEDEVDRLRTAVAESRRDSQQQSERMNDVVAAAREDIKNLELYVRELHMRSSDGR